MIARAADPHVGDLVTNHSDWRVSSPVRAVPPEVVAGLARRQRQAVAGGERALGVGAPEAPEDQQSRQVDERERAASATTTSSISKAMRSV